MHLYLIKDDRVEFLNYLNVCVKLDVLGMVKDRLQYHNPKNVVVFLMSFEKQQCIGLFGDF